MDEIEENQTNHFPQFMEKCKRCKYCLISPPNDTKHKYQPKSKYRCQKCSMDYKTDIALCVLCFIKFHRNLDENIKKLKGYKQKRKILKKNKLNKQIIIQQEQSRTDNREIYDQQNYEQKAKKMIKVDFQRFNSQGQQNSMLIEEKRTPAEQILMLNKCLQVIESESIKLFQSIEAKKHLFQYIKMMSMKLRQWQNKIQFICLQKSFPIYYYTYNMLQG